MIKTPYLIAPSFGPHHKAQKMKKKNQSMCVIFIYHHVLYLQFWVSAVKLFHLKWNNQ